MTGKFFSHLFIYMRFVSRIEYPAIRMATLTRKCLFLETVCDDGSTTILSFQLHSQKAANGLYRCVTEMYSFYLCDTVRSTVASQYSRDLKGILAALFNENTTLGKLMFFGVWVIDLHCVSFVALRYRFTINSQRLC